MASRKTKTPEGENESVDVPADDPQPFGPADPGEITELEQEQPLRQEPSIHDDPEEPAAE